MPSPFPGMDPYLERHWLDVHARLVTYAADALNGVLPPDLIARTEERLVVDSVEYAQPRAIYPDARVYEDQRRSASNSPTSTSAAVAEPIILELETEDRPEGYVTILDASGGQLVTVVEFLSPSNKLAGPNREQYRQKREEVLAARVNLIEIDLTRQGPWWELMAPYVVPAWAQTPYRTIVRRFNPEKRVELYRIPLRSRLPTIPVPLRATDGDVTLELQRLIEQAYDNGRYDRTDYTRGCSPPLDGHDAAWAEELLKATGRRGA